MATRQRPSRLELGGSLWITAGGRNLGGHGRIALLRAVAEQGSITHAAKACGMSYKAAWEAIETMNSLAGAPLVARSTGGRGGGSTQLTAQGQLLVERFEQIDAVHQRYVALLDRQAFDLATPFSPLQALNLRTSARNQWVGTVAAVRSGEVNDEVELLLPGGARLMVSITRASSDALALRPRQTVIALAKASLVRLLAEGVPVPAQNHIGAAVREVQRGVQMAEVLLDGDGGVPVVATVPVAQVAALGLEAGRRVVAVVKASDLLLAVAE